jgi:hypothetical protein
MSSQLRGYYSGFRFYTSIVTITQGMNDKLVVEAENFRLLCVWRVPIVVIVIKSQ